MHLVNTPLNSFKQIARRAAIKYKIIVEYFDVYILY